MKLKSIRKKIIIKEEIDKKNDDIINNDLAKLDLNKPDEEENIIKNKGTGAGGKKTNTNGLTFEKETDFKNYFIKLGYEDCSKGGFKTFLKKNKIENNLIDGCKSPDECYINNTIKHIIVIEKKFQNMGGSVCEKIQTAPFKKLFFEKLTPNYKITYAYVLSNWFELNCREVIDLLINHYKIPISIVKDKYINEKFVDELLK